jgi:hypothetical protein
MFQKIIHNWSFIRFVRLILGIFIIIQSVQTQNYWMILPGILFSAMALFNTGCCGSSCSVPIKNQKND